MSQSATTFSPPMAAKSAAPRPPTPMTPTFKRSLAPFALDGRNIGAVPVNADAAKKERRDKLFFLAIMRSFCLFLIDLVSQQFIYMRQYVVLIRKLTAVVIWERLGNRSILVVNNDGW